MQQPEVFLVGQAIPQRRHPRLLLWCQVGALLHRGVRHAGGCSMLDRQLAAGRVSWRQAAKQLQQHSAVPVLRKQGTAQCS